MTIRKLFLLLIALFHSHFIDAVEASLRGYVLDLEIVESKEDRARGLMYRSSLATNSGMLFKWPEASQKCIWMKNTSLDLSLAYLDERLIIREIYNLVPFSEENVCSKSQNIRYALEVNKGWFDEREIKVFSKLSISD